MNDKSNAVTVNDEQQLFVIPESRGGYSCLGFQVCEDRCVALARELGALGYDLRYPHIMGTIERYEQYRGFQEIARKHSDKTGYRFHCELTKELIGLEGKRVELTDEFGTRRFWVGRSTGWIPCHLEIETRRSMGGVAVCAKNIQCVVVVGGAR